MASKTIKICDKCGAQFDMSEPQRSGGPLSKRHPVYKTCWGADLGVGAGDTGADKELCELCRDKFIKMCREFFK